MSCLNNIILPDVQLSHSELNGHVIKFFHSVVQIAYVFLEQDFSKSLELHS